MVQSPLEINSPWTSQEILRSLWNPQFSSSFAEDKLLLYCAVPRCLQILLRVCPFLRSRQSLSYARISQHFMEPESSLPCSQEPSTGPCSQPDEFNPYHLSNIHFNIILPPTSWFSGWSLSFWLCRQNPICLPLLPRECYMSCSSHHRRLIDHCICTWWRVSVIFSVCSFLQPLVISSLFGPIFLLRNLFRM
jgi:hypothetical protein